jgi:hypothetical protein
LLTGPGAVGYVQGDVTSLGPLLEQAAGLLDFRRPVAVLLTHAVNWAADPDGGNAREITRRLADALPPGSFLVVAGLSSCPSLEAAMSCYSTAGGVPCRLWSPQQAAALLGGLEPLAPGVALVRRWRPEHSLFPDPDAFALGGVGRKAP